MLLISAEQPVITTSNMILLRYVLVIMLATTFFGDEFMKNIVVGFVYSIQYTVHMYTYL